jgi:autotransporter-associated beta strand protein
MVGWTSGAHADPPSGNWRLVHADEFSGTSIDSVKWATQYQWGRTHNHDAYMLDSNVIVDDGDVALRAVRTTTNGEPFSSGVISSHDAFRVTSGYVEARIKMSSRRGTWPAFWMLRAGWPPEIDIVEYPLFTDSTTNDTYSVNNFWPGDGPPSDFLWVDRNIDLSADYHNYGLKLDTTGLSFYFDGNLVKQSSYKPDFYDMYLIFNHAVGGWPGAPSTSQWPNGATDEVRADWIRVWRAAPASSESTWSYNAAANGSWDTAANWSGSIPNFDRQNVVLPTLAGRSSIEVRWNGSRTIGSLTLNGATVYTLGQAGGGVESLMFADQVDSVSELRVEAGGGGHVFNSRLDLWSNLLAVNNTANPVIFNGDVVGQARTVGTRPTLASLTLAGSGKFVLNGRSYYQGHTIISGGVTVDLNNRLYADGNEGANSIVSISGGSRLELSDSMDNSFGGLNLDPEKLVIDNGTVVVPGSRGTNFHAFTIGAGGATFEVPAGFIANFEQDSVRHIVSNLGGDLTLAGAGTGRFYKAFGGSGDLVKRGTGTWEVHGSQLYSGQTVIDEGMLKLVDTATGNGDTLVQSLGTLSGTGEVRGSLINDGRVVPGNSAGPLQVLGNYDQLSNAVFEFDIQASTDGSQHRLAIDGAARLDGTLSIDLMDGYQPAVGDAFAILTAASIVGTMELVGESQGFRLLMTPTSLVLHFGPLLPGDYDLNEVVDAADYTMWRDTLGQTVPAGTGADGDNSGTIDSDDYSVWKTNFGLSDGTGGAAGRTVVPEPGSLLTNGLAIGFISVVCRSVNRQRTARLWA